LISFQAEESGEIPTLPASLEECSNHISFFFFFSKFCS